VTAYDESTAAIEVLADLAERGHLMVDFVRFEKNDIFCRENDLDGRVLHTLQTTPDKFHQGFSSVRRGTPNAPGAVFQSVRPATTATRWSESRMTEACDSERAALGQDGRPEFG